MSCNTKRWRKRQPELDWSDCASINHGMLSALWVLSLMDACVVPCVRRGPCLRLSVCPSMYVCARIMQTDRRWHDLLHRTLHLSQSVKVNSSRNQRHCISSVAVIERPFADVGASSTIIVITVVQRRRTRRRQRIIFLADGLTVVWRTTRLRMTLDNNSWITEQWRTAISYHLSTQCTTVVHRTTWWLPSGLVYICPPVHWTRGTREMKERIKLKTNFIFSKMHN